jgi:hypothetical protein
MCGPAVPSIIGEKVTNSFFLRAGGRCYPAYAAQDAYPDSETMEEDHEPACCRNSELRVEIYFFLHAR